MQQMPETPGVIFQAPWLVVPSKGIPLACSTNPSGPISSWIPSRNHLWSWQNGLNWGQCHPILPSLSLSPAAQRWSLLVHANFLPASLPLSSASFPCPCLTPGSRHLQQEASRQAATNGLALAALVPGPPELWRQRGSIIECSIDKPWPPQQQISAGQGQQRVGGRPPSVHTASSFPEKLDRSIYLSIIHNQSF